MKTYIGAALIFQLFFVAGVASADGLNLVPNGSFEGGSYAGDAADGTLGDTIPNGWILESPDTPNSDFQIENTVNSAIDQGPEDGSYYAAFMSPANPITDGQDCLLTFLNTVPGQQYTVTFYVAITAAAVSNTFLDPVWGFEQANQTDMINNFYYTPTNTGPVGYQEFTFTETAISTGTNLIFHGTDGSGAILLDNVSVVADQTPTAPEPSSFLSGISGLCVGLLLLKRRKVFEITRRD